MFKIVPLNFNSFQGYQNVKTVDNTITLSELIAYCLPSFLHIYRHKAASRDRQLMAMSRPSHCININISYSNQLRLNPKIDQQEYKTVTFCLMCPPVQRTSFRKGLPSLSNQHEHGGLPSPRHPLPHASLHNCCVPYDLLSY